MSSKHPPFIQIPELINDLSTGQFGIVLCLLPSHVAVTGNTMADAAKKTLNQSVTPLLIPYSDYRPSIRSYIRELMQKKWDTQVGVNALHDIKPHIAVELCD